MVEVGHWGLGFDGRTFPFPSLPSPPLFCFLPYSSIPRMPPPPTPRTLMLLTTECETLETEGQNKPSPKLRVKINLPPLKQFLWVFCRSVKQLINTHGPRPRHANANKGQRQGVILPDPPEGAGLCLHKGDSTDSLVSGCLLYIG